MREKGKTISVAPLLASGQWRLAAWDNEAQAFVPVPAHEVIQSFGHVAEGALAVMHPRGVVHLQYWDGHRWDDGFGRTLFRSAHNGQLYWLVERPVRLDRGEDLLAQPNKRVWEWDPNEGEDVPWLYGKPIQGPRGRLP